MSLLPRGNGAVRFAICCGVIRKLSLSENELLLVAGCGGEVPYCDACCCRGESCCAADDGTAAAIGAVEVDVDVVVIVVECVLFDAAGSDDAVLVKPSKLGRLCDEDSRATRFLTRDFDRVAVVVAAAVVVVGIVAKLITDESPSGAVARADNDSEPTTFESLESSESDAEPVVERLPPLL